MFRRLLIRRRDAEQHRLAKSTAEKIDRYGQSDRLRRQQIARSLAAIGAANRRAIVDLLDVPGGYDNCRVPRIGTRRGANG